MTEFFNSKFMKDLQAGTLPPVEIDVPTKVYVGLGLTVVLSALIILVVNHYLSK
ncbi:MAG: hypothetical protein AB7U05_08940 [Mangrovibacterium sp.]